MNKICILTVCFLLAVGSVFAQNRSDLRINEVLTHNVDNYIDDFGRHGAWIEIFNSSYGTVDIGGCYLTNDLSDPKKYPIPRGDVLTKIAPRQHVVFWANNHPTDGTFHLSFTIDNDDCIALFSNDGKLIDSVTLPVMAADESYGRLEDGGAEWGFFEKTTPSTNNILKALGASASSFKENDPWGVAMAITAMAVVFTALLLLFVAFKSVGKLLMHKHHKREKPHVEAVATGVKKEASPSDVYAAIAFAIQQYQKDIQLIEKAVLTINKVARAYSPWSSKIYGLREVPQKK
ncbi:hypothetical protein FACS189452_07910 [Bacteroidia bacterium]|nr:hypothetical protein FACS189452_07910 [Bacteroidia bacterium]GHT82250.1 hypothetical protein FACS189467_7340 [Bacteroidia bacterium]